jgi:hypothetical protein
MSTAAPQTDLPKPNAATDAEKGENRTAFIRNIVGIRAKPPSDKIEKKEVEDATAKPVDKQADKPAVKKKAAAKPEAPRGINLDEARELVVTGVREALKPAEKKSEDEPKPTDKLSDKDKKRFSVFEQMEKNNPSNAGLAQKFIANLTKHEEYKKSWEGKNPGREFNIADDDHADFVSANDLTWDQDEYVEALTDIKSGKAISKVEDKFKNEISGVRRAEIAREERPVINRHQAATAKILFKELGDDFAKVLDDSGNINIDEIKKLVEDNPIYGKVVFPLAQKVEEFSGELMRVARGHVTLREKEPTPSEWAQMTPTDRQRHILHREIINYAVTQEKIFEKLPDDQKLNQRGQAFTTSDQWEKMNPAQREKHWVLTDKDLSALYAMDASVAAKKSIEDEEGNFKKIAEKRGIKLPDKSAAAAKPAGKPADTLNENPNGEHGDRRPPPATIVPRMAKKEGGEKNEKTSTLAKILGRG